MPIGQRDKGPVINATSAREFLAGAGTRPYRELVRHHIERQSVGQLRDAGMGEAAMLPRNLQPDVMQYIDAVNSSLGHDRLFWRTATCQEAFDRIIGIALGTLPLSDRIRAIGDASTEGNDGLAFQLFQIPTLNFAYSAATQAAQRRFMGISRFPWVSAIALLYPVVAAATLYRDAQPGGHSAALLLSVGYGLANLGYVLLAAGLVGGAFGALGLYGRRKVVIFGAAAWLLGTVISNLG